MVDIAFEFTYFTSLLQHILHLLRSMCAMCFELDHDPGLHRHLLFKLRAPMCRVCGEELVVAYSAGDGRVWVLLCTGLSE